jgi:hypothetical protein
MVVEPYDKGAGQGRQGVRIWNSLSGIGHRRLERGESESRFELAVSGVLRTSQANHAESLRRYSRWITSEGGDEVQPRSHQYRANVGGRIFVRMPGL